MGEVVNFVVAVAVIVVVFRWATSSKETTGGPPSPSAILGFKPKNITPEQVDTVHNMFPDIPSDNIRYDLLRTGSVQLTSTKILERGYLPPPPPAYYTLYPRTEQTAPQAAQQAAAAAAPAASSSKPKQSLISRYNLENRVTETSSSAEQSGPAEVEHVWDASPEKREANLRERKARMVLAARERLLAQQKAQAASASTSS